MKKVYITLFMAVMAISAVAQNRPVQDKGFMGANSAKLAPKLMAQHQLTAQQQESITKLRFELKAELLQINNQLTEKRAQLKSLQQVDKPSNKAINSKIDEITDLQNNKMKMIAQNQIKVRENLTAEQRLQYDLRINNRKRGSKRGAMNQRGAMDHRGTMNHKGDMDHNGAINSRESMNYKGMNIKRGAEHNKEGKIIKEELD